MSAPNKTRLSVYIGDETAEQLRKMAEDGLTVTEAVRRAVAVYKFFDDARNGGQKIQLVDRHGDVFDVTMFR